jgi:hypothetical protein
VLVHVAAAALFLLACSSAALAQSRPFAVLDNSFLVEEAFNQEPGIFQNIFGIHADAGDGWEAAFTQEWPVFSQTHQISYTVGALGANGSSGLADLMINYRWQATSESTSSPAFSPRLSIIFATGDAERGFGSGGPGWQINLPFSKQFGDTYLHWNAGFTHTPSAEIAGREYNLLTPHVAVSGIWRMRPMFNLMLESLVEWEHSADGDGTRRETGVTLSPGFRTGWDVGETQTIFGFAVPIAMSGDATSAGVFGYVSYELPFIRQQP